LFVKVIIFKIQYDNIRISIGAKSLDKIFRGGLETKTKTQLYGPHGSCKTQLCFTICAILPPNFKTIFIDTEGTFRSERIQQISKARQMNVSLDNIFYSRASIISELEICIDSIEKKIGSDTSIKLLIIDSMTNLGSVNLR
jgi:DNA repair protein RadA